MPPSSFSFTRIVVPGQPATQAYQVRLGPPSGPLIGSVTDYGDRWQASVVVAGKLHTRPFDDRERAAAWLLGLAPKHVRR